MVDAITYLLLITNKMTPAVTMMTIITPTITVMMMMLFFASSTARDGSEKKYKTVSCLSFCPYQLPHPPTQ